LILLLAACTTPAAPGATSPSSAAAPAAVPAAKVLTVALQTEPRAFDSNLFGVLSGEGGVTNVQYLVNDALWVQAEVEDYRPQLAVALPSIEAGTWKINPDGTMDTTWKLRPNVRWHDGAPFTADDLVFTFGVYTNPDFPTRTEGRPLMESVSAPDPLTFVVHWKTTFVNAYREPPGDDVLPRHLLGDLYKTDTQAFVNSTYFHADYVGLGPYKLTQWVQGSHLELARFDDYYQGRPKLDTIYVRFVTDPSTAVANILAGAVDVVLPPAVDLDTALDVQQRWAGTGNQVHADLDGKFTLLDPQVRPEFAQPRDGFTNTVVRQAFYHAIDRATVTEVITHGLSPVADSYFAPHEPLRAQVESFIPQFPYDPTRAQQLLAQAGWVKGPDGALVNQTTGERFSTEVRGPQGGGNEKLLSLVADGWKQVGATADIVVVPSARLGDREYASTRPGFNVTNPSGPPFYERNRLHSSQVTSAANRFTGINSGGYANPRVDEILNQLRMTIDPRQRLPLQQQLVQLQIGELGVMPLFWEVYPLLMIKGVSGPKLVLNAATQNIYDWDRT
jgi:peptide/nickel transport system substrate-binding protein